MLFRLLMSPLRRVIQFYRPEALGILGVVVLLLLGTGANLLKPWPTAILVDFLAGSSPHPILPSGDTTEASKARFVAIVALITILLHGLRAAFSAATEYFSIRIGLRVLARVRQQLAACLQDWTWRSQQTMTSGDLIYRASWDTYSIQTLFQQGIMVVGSSALSLVIMVGIMLRIHVGLTCISLTIAPLLVLVIRVLSVRMADKANTARDADSRVTSLIQQMIQHLPLIQTFLRGSFVRKEFQKQTDAARDARLSQHGTEILYGLLVSLVFGFGAALILWFGATYVMTRQISLGQLMIFLSYLALLYEPLNQLSNVGATLSTAKAGVRRVLEVLDTPGESADTPNPVPLPDLSKLGDGRREPLLEFKDVSFAYEPGKNVLRGVSFQVFPGDVVAVLGPSGVGKSTLLHLVSRFYDPVSGVVRMGGQDLRQVSRSELRAQVAVLFQEAVLLPGTVADNIGFGREGATREEIIAAARSANAHAFIEALPQGYDTPVGEGSARLSVGEKQRVSLARAFLKNAPIVLLDEPTSALDDASEQLVIEGLRRLSVGRTVLLVTHRPALLAIASHRLQLEAGTVPSMTSI